MGGKPSDVQTVVDARGATSTVTYARSPASVVLQFDQDVAKTSQAKLGSIAWCTPQDLTSMAEVVKDLSSRLGEPTSRSPEADADPADAPAVWLDSPCGVEVRTYKQASEWWSGSTGTVCVQLHSVPVTDRKLPPSSRETVTAQPPTPPGAAGPIVVAAPSPGTSAGNPVPEPPSGDEVSRQPELIKESYVPPRYPLLQRGLRVETRVLLQAIVHPDGKVGEVSVLESSRPNLGFEDAAIEAVKKWRYKPGMRDGEVVDMPITINVVFR